MCIKYRCMMVNSESYNMNLVNIGIIFLLYAIGAISGIIIDLIGIAL